MLNKSIIIGLVALSGIYSIKDASAQVINDSKSVSRKISRGKTVEIQTMYYTRGCKSDLISPKPILKGKLNFGSITYRTGKTRPSQCPLIKINANFADYTAAGKAGIDKFDIHWKASNGSIFVRSYKIEVQ